MRKRFEGWLTRKALSWLRDRGVSVVCPLCELPIYRPEPVKLNVVEVCGICGDKVESFRRYADDFVKCLDCATKGLKRNRSPHATR